MQQTDYGSFRYHIPHFFLLRVHARHSPKSPYSLALALKCRITVSREAQAQWGGLDQKGRSKPKVDRGVAIR